MKRRNFLFSAAAGIVCFITGQIFGSNKNKRVLLIQGEVLDYQTIMPISEDKIKSQYKEISFKSLKKDDIFLLEYNNKFDGPFKATGNVEPYKNTYAIMIEPMPKKFNVRRVL